MSNDDLGRYALWLLAFVLPFLAVLGILDVLDLRQNDWIALLGVFLSLFLSFRIMYWLDWRERRQILEMFALECRLCGKFFKRELPVEPDRALLGFGWPKAPRPEEMTCDACLGRAA